VQWFSLLVSAVGASLIARRLGGDGRAGWLAAVLTVTLPMAILQATGTQNDLVEAMWLVILAWSVLRFRDLPSPANAGWVGAALGLAVLTKGTGYTLAFVLMVWFGLATLREMRGNAWRPFVIVVVLFFALNSGHYLRNWADFGNPLGTAEGYGNETFSAAVFGSNTLRNLTLNATTPSDTFNRRVFLRPVRWAHNNVFNLALDDPRTTYLNMAYSYNYISANEDTAPNPAHFFLAFIAGAVYTVGALRRRNARQTVYLLVIAATFLTFSALLKWQIWHTRLLTPLFILFMPWIAVEVRRWPRVIGDTLAVLLLLAALPYALLNCNRPLVSAGWPPFTCGRPPVFAPADVTTFNSRMGLREPYLAAADALNDVACFEVGLVMEEDSWEYPVWTLVEGQREFYHINVDNGSQFTPVPPPEMVCAVWAAPAPAAATLTYNGTRFERIVNAGAGPDSAALYLPID
jgi:4-amino-4-deoxy-L-arabinose transferase-like glycosyltransferase